LRLRTSLMAPVEPSFRSRHAAPSPSPRGRTTIAAVVVATIALLLPTVTLAKSHTHAKPLIVVLDPGHGGVMRWGDESGAVDPTGTLLEKDMTLKVAIQTASDLRKMGYTVYLTRTSDQHVNTPARDWNHDGKVDHIDEMDARTMFANQHHADLFLSIHFDGSTDPSMHGTHGYYCPARPFWKSSKRLAGLLTASVSSSVTHAGYSDPNNGIQTDVADIVSQARADYPWFLVLGPSRHHWLTGTAMPGALIETMYMSSPRDDAAMRKPAIVNAVARGYADGIHAYFGGHTTR
jgi:N-acetylmuramoyl-L-alanine amidase